MKRFAIMLSTASAVFVGAARSGRWFLMPLLVVLGLATLLLAAVTVLEYVAPFVYTVF